MAATAPLPDQGLFGPGSVTWRVHAHPVMIVGGLRALLIQSLHPHAMAGVAQHSDYRGDPLRRLRQTARYVATVTYGDTAQAREAGARVRRVHRRVHGIDPVTGTRYSAEDPETLLWVHCVEVHSFLAAYRAYGGRMPSRERDRYLAEQVAAAELVGIPREIVPDSTQAYRDYFERMLPRLCTSADTAATIAFVRDPTMPTTPLPARIALGPAFRLLGRAAVALVPRSLRPIAGLPAPGPGDLPAAAAVATAANAVAVALAVPGLRILARAPFAALLGDAARPVPSR